MANAVVARQSRSHALPPDATALRCAKRTISKLRSKAAATTSYRSDFASIPRPFTCSTRALNNNQRNRVLPHAKLSDILISLIIAGTITLLVVGMTLLADSMTDFAPVWLESNRVWMTALERRGNATPIVLMHGVGGNALWFKPLIDALGGRHVIALDMPGHGGSAQASGWQMEDLAELVFKAISRRANSKVIWGGHSWGGKVAAMIAALHPEAAHSLLLLDPSLASGIAIPPETFVDIMFGGELGPWNSLDEAKDSARHLPQYTNWNADLEHAFERGVARGPDGKWRARVSRETLIAICAAVGKDHSATMRKVACPTLFVVADQSLGWQEINFALLPQATRVVIRSNHWLMSGNPAELHRAVSNWLRAGGEREAQAA
jgi:pimeloyl-ACP methyl ester carboxylesterase